MAMIVHVLLSLWGSILHYPESQNQEVLHAAKIAHLLKLKSKKTKQTNKKNQNPNNIKCSNKKL